MELLGLVGGIINGDPVVFFKAGVETGVTFRVRGGDNQENLTIRVEVRHQAPSFSTLNMFRRRKKIHCFDLKQAAKSSAQSLKPGLMTES
jgi:hypothetical protein